MRSDEAASPSSSFVVESSIADIHEALSDWPCRLKFMKFKQLPHGCVSNGHVDIIFIAKMMITDK